MSRDNLFYVYDDKLQSAEKRLESMDVFDSSDRHDEALKVVNHFDLHDCIRLFEEFIDLELAPEMSFADVRHELVRFTARKIRDNLEEKGL